MGQIQRYDAVKFGNPDNWHATLSPDDNGSAILYADHLAALSAKDEQIRQLREALEAFMGLPHLLDDVCVDERPACKVCAAINLCKQVLEAK